MIDWAKQVFPAFSDVVAGRINVCRSMKKRSVLFYKSPPPHSKIRDAPGFHRMLYVCMCIYSFMGPLSGLVFWGFKQQFLIFDFWRAQSKGTFFISFFMNGKYQEFAVFFFSLSVKT